MNEQKQIKRILGTRREVESILKEYNSARNSDKVLINIYLKKKFGTTCGSRMFWFDKNNKDTVYMDNRELTDTLCDGRKLEIRPDILGDFRSIPFKDDTFSLVVFDPPHLHKIGDNAWMAKKYGKLTNTWPQDIEKGFDECMRVLKPNGTLVFKWNEEQIKLKQILDIIKYKPLFGDKRAKTHWPVS